MLQRLARNEVDVAATAIGIPPEELRRAVDEGHTISAVAANAGIVAPGHRRSGAGRMRVSGHRGVAAGNVASDRAKGSAASPPARAERFVLSTPVMVVGGLSQA